MNKLITMIALTCLGASVVSAATLKDVKLEIFCPNVVNGTGQDLLNAIRNSPFQTPMADKIQGAQNVTFYAAGINNQGVLICQYGSTHEMVGVVLKPEYVKAVFANPSLTQAIGNNTPPCYSRLNCGAYIGIK